MNYLKLALTGVALIGLSACVSVEANVTEPISMTAPSFSDRTKIKAAVMDYFEGQGQGSFERLDRAFNDEASMFGVTKNDDGEDYLRVWPKMSDVIVNWSETPRPDAPARDGEIMNIDVADGRIATVMFRSTDRFYDALTLVKIDGQWEIASKVFVRQNP